MATVLPGSIGAADGGFSANDRFVLRMAVASTIAFGFALWFGLPFGVMVPALVVKMVPAMPTFPSAVQGLMMPLVMWVGTTVALLVVSLLDDAPAVEMLVLGLLLYLTYYIKRLGIPAVIPMLLQIALCIVPLFSSLSLPVGHLVAGALQKGAIFAAVTVFLSHLLVPAPRSLIPAAPAGPPRLAPPVAARVALADTLVLFPMLSFLLLETAIHNFVMIMMVINILSDLAPTRSRAMGVSMVTGNTIGGLVAVLVQQVVFLADTLVFFLLTVFLTMIWFGGGLARGGRTYDLFRLGGGTFVLILGLGVAPQPGGSESTYFQRIIMILVAGAYTLIALPLVASLRQRDPDPAALKA